MREGSMDYEGYETDKRVGISKSLFASRDAL